MAPTLQLIGGTTVGPAGSLSVNIHRLPKDPEEVLPLPPSPPFVYRGAVHQFGSCRPCGIDVSGYACSTRYVRSKPSLLGKERTEGTKILNGKSRQVGPGDMFIIPPDTPHTFTEITTDRIVYMVVRVDPHKILQAD
jgi:hypothetical protein